MSEWATVTVKLATLEEAVKLANELYEDGLKDVTVDHSSWQDAE